MKILEKFTSEQIKDILENSDSFRDFLSKIGSSSNGTGAYKSIKQQLSNLGIGLPIFEYKKLKSNKVLLRLSDDSVFVENSTFSRTNLKKRIIKDNIIEYICNKCKNEGFWQSENLSLQLEHKNGISNDNRIENLEFLCPNCHSQTKTYSGKKKIIDYKCGCGEKIIKGSKFCIKCNNIKQRKVVRPSYQDLVIDVDKMGYVKTGLKYGVSDNAVRKWLKQYKKLNTV